jgi:hypothetical protein
LQRWKHWLALTVVALPNASKTGVELSTTLAIGSSSAAPLVERQQRYWSRYLLASVLPAPEMPVTTMDWLRPVSRSCLYAAAPTEKM